MIELAKNWLFPERNSTALAALYKKIVMFEWFAVASLTSWLLLIFSTILH